MKTFEQLQHEWGESSCGRSIERFIYDHYEAQHPKAWNAAIEAAKGIIRNDLNIKLGDADRIIEKLQALKLDPNQA